MCCFILFKLLLINRYACGEKLAHYWERFELLFSSFG